MQRERERQFVVCVDSCFQSTGPQKDDVIHERECKFSKNTESRNEQTPDYENNKQ